MEIDWEIEVGGGAPAIEALWASFVDLRRHPERVGEIAEIGAFPPLGRLLLALNGENSGFWTAKCDFWFPDANEAGLLPEEVAAASNGVAVACYVDILPVEGLAFATWMQAEDCCRRWTRELGAIPMEHCRMDLVVRQAIAGAAEGFGITAYAGGWGCDEAEARARLEAALAVFADAIHTANGAKALASKLQ